MVTRDELPEDGRVDEITVTVNAVRRNPKPKRAVELTVVDRGGQELECVIWSTHDVDVNWREGHRYTLRNARGKVWNGDPSTAVLHSTSDLRVEHRGADTPASTSVLVIGDTHVGYRHRNRTGKARWARNIDARDGFERAIEIAKERNVDAILHAGDVFDHEAIQDDYLRVSKSLVDPLKADIPFHYIRGNHDPARGMKGLREFAEGAEQRLRLGNDPITIGEYPVTVYGQDYTGTGPSGDKFTPPSAPGPNILVIHETPFPVIGDDGLLYEDAVDLREILDAASVEFDLIIVGHLHVANQGRVLGHDVPVLITGPTARISNYKRDNEPSAWLVTFAAEGLDIERLPL